MTCRGRRTHFARRELRGWHGLDGEESVLPATRYQGRALSTTLPTSTPADPQRSPPMLFVEANVNLFECSAAAGLGQPGRIAGCHQRGRRGFLPAGTTSKPRALALSRIRSSNDRTCTSGDRLRTASAVAK